MAKRSTDSQLTKDDYDQRGHDDDNDDSVMGSFKQASSEELSKRVIKAPRSRKLAGASNDDAQSKPSPFAAMASFSTPVTSQPATGSSGLFSFGVTPNKPSPSTFATTSSFSTTTAAPMFGGFGGETGFGKAPSSFAKSASKADDAASDKETKDKDGGPGPQVPAAKPLAATSPSVSGGTFLFNGTSTEKVAPDSISSARAVIGSNVPTDRAQYERTIQALNRTFMEKIEKEFGSNPIVNLAQIFSQYTTKRQAIKLKFSKPQPSESSNDEKESPSGSTTESATGSMAKVSQPDPISAAATSGEPKLSFGVPLSAIGENEPPKKSFSGFNFGVPATITTQLSTKTPDSNDNSKSIFGGFGSSTTNTNTAPSKPAGTSGWNFGVPSTNSLTATSTSSISADISATKAASTTSAAPFSFSGTKPFQFTPPATQSSTAITPKPFAGFQLPAATPASSADSQTEDSEKMPDDTKSQLLESHVGEEGETTVFEVRAKLFAFEDGQHKDLGVGQFRVNENTETKKRRMIMRTGGTGMITLNSWVIQGMGPMRDKKTVTVFGIKDGKPKRYLLRVKEEQSAIDLVKELEAGQLNKE
ncbi:hypothetical protein BG011_000055 [Mortierella polycephala]|uniref:RanBD1 domain-containing protein n=1 Tax=Mortierella polycephala TaxID=41804 RepID=A0A9P6QIG0_9FUNG|nr:hypothetical protein BG011_000055 [Mortierella polycephala]